MRNSPKVSLAFLLLAFATLWLPLGQQGFLLEHWMKVGVFMAPFLLFVAVAFRSKSSEDRRVDLRFWSLLLLVAYIIHQFEEHSIDLFGNVYAFKPYLNSLLIERFGGSSSASGPLSDAGVFVINTSLVWLVASLAIWRAPRHVFPALCMASIVAVNAVSHIGAAVLTFGYNPGLLTAIALFIPLGLTVYVRSSRSGDVDIRAIIASLVWGILAHIIMIAGMIASGWFGVIPEIVYFAVLVGWSVLPVFLYRSDP